jgi:predicted glycogen debranching enzyme
MKLPTLSFTSESFSRFEYALRKEWIVTNGLGGYSSSTVLGINTRKYHGLLVAALHPPGDRTVCLSKLDEEVGIGRDVYSLGANEFQGAVYPEGYQFLKQFSVSPFPRYVYGFREVEVEKTLFMPHEKNAVVAIYRVMNSSNSVVNVKVTPLVTCRHFHSVVDRWRNPLSFSQQPIGIGEVQVTFTAPSAAVSIRATEGLFHEQPNWIERLLYREEASRGESSIDDCYQPGYFEVPVPAKTEDKFAVSAVAGENGAENSKVLDEICGTTSDAERLLNREFYLRNMHLANFYGSKPAVPASDWSRWILLAADAFMAKGGNGRKSIIAGYHWFEAWGRDTFISLPGLMLVTGRFDDARNVFNNFSSHLRGGLVPNFFDDHSGEASYNTVDASLWFVNAVLQYLKYTRDFTFVRMELWENLQDIVEKHLKGTDFGIHMDSDGLLAHGPRLTWMDAEVEGKPATPREGKAVEIQALWYNALRTMQVFAARFGEKNLKETYAELAAKAQASFREKFWNNERNCLFDVVADSGSDISLRPNQIFAVALDFPILDRDRNTRIVDIVERELLTPCGLRTLDRNDPRYKGFYVGNRQNRDQAYHNGTVWPWLTGPFTAAFLKAKGYNRKNSEIAMERFVLPLFTKQISEGGLGTVNEIFDGDSPHTPRGCIAQAWSVAEPLRAYVENALQVRPRFEKEALKI